jgi:DNA-binding response OmpR family regulator
MPGINGASLVKAVRSVRPGLRTLMMTDLAELQAGEEIGTENIIRKPFNDLRRSRHRTVMNVR